MLRPARFFVWLSVTGLLVSACRVVVETNISPNGSGTLDSAVVYSASEKANFAQAPGNESKSICDSIKPPQHQDVTFTEQIRGDETFCTTRRSFDDLAQLQSLYAQMNDVTMNKLEFQLGELSLDVSVDLMDKGDQQPAAQEWRITLPGRIDSHNADRVEGQTLIWMISPNQRADLRATARVGLNLVTLGTTGDVLVATACLLLFVLGAASLYLIARRSAKVA